MTILRQVIIIEEAAAMLSEMRQLRDRLGEPQLQEQFRRVRKFGIGLLIVDQYLAGVPASTFENLNIKVVANISHDKSLMRAASSMGLTDEQKKAISGLEPRRIVVKSQELRSAVLVKVAEVTFPPAPTESELREQMKPILASIPWTPPHEVKKEPVIEKLTQWMRTEEVESAKKDLTLDAEKYLSELSKKNNHFLPLGIFDARFGKSTEASQKLREELKSFALVTEFEVQTGGRGRNFKSLKITETGLEYLKKRGVHPDAYLGRGSLQALFWYYAVARWCQKNHPGCSVRIEWQRPGTVKAVDVSCEVSAGVFCAYEVEMSESPHVTQNLVKDILAGYDECTVCALSEPELDHIKEQLCTDIGLGSQFVAKVSFLQLKSFLEVYREK